MPHRHGLFLLLIAALALTAAFGAPAPVQAAPAQVPPTFSAWLVTPFPAPLCPGDRVSISVMTMQTSPQYVPASGYPMNILQSSPAIGHLDPVSKVVINGTADFTYIAEDGAEHGTQTDVLTFNIGGYPTGLTVPVTVYGACDYRLNLLMEQHILEETTYLDTIISGELVLKRVTGQAHGEGTDDVYLTMGDNGEAFVCALAPAIQGSSTFQADATFSPVSPGVETFFFDLIFDGVMLNGAMLHCENLIGDMNVNANVPFPESSWDPDELGLQGLNMTLTNGAGSVPVSYKELRGQVTVRREVRQ